MIRRVSVWMALIALVMTLPLVAQRGDDAKRKSKNGKTEGTVAGAAVTVEYGRPNVGGRAIWGALVPYGQVWRTGADEATTIAFDRDVLIEGQKLAKGTYALFTIPTETTWTVIFNKTAKQWGAYDYDAKQDALRVSVASYAHEPTEELTFTIQGEKVMLSWEKRGIEFRVAAAQ